MSSNQPSYMTNRAKNHKFYKKVKWKKFLTFKSKALIKSNRCYISKIMAVRLTKHNDTGVNTNLLLTGPSRNSRPRTSIILQLLVQTRP